MTKTTAWPLQKLVVVICFIIERSRVSLKKHFLILVWSSTGLESFSAAMINTFNKTDVKCKVAITGRQGTY